MLDRLLILGAAASVFQAGTAWAHPGHGSAGAGTAAHYITDPFHGTIAVFAVLGALALAGRVLRAVGTSASKPPTTPNSPETRQG